MGGHLEILQLNHPLSADFPAHLFDWHDFGGVIRDPYVTIDDAEEFYDAITTCPGAVRKEEPNGIPYWLFPADRGGGTVNAHSNFIIRYKTPSRDEYERVVQSLAFSCSGDIGELKHMPERLPSGASIHLVGIRFNRADPCLNAAEGILRHLLPAYPQFVIWYTGGDTVYDLATFQQCIEKGRYL